MSTPFVFPEPPWPDAGVEIGSDMSCYLRNVSLEMPDGSFYAGSIFDFREDMGMVSGRQLLAEALARRVITRRGSLLFDPNYGFDVTRYLNDDIDARELGVIASGMDTEFLKDERALSATTTAVLAADILITTSVIQDSKGPFKLVLAISEVTVTILQVQP